MKFLWIHRLWNENVTVEWWKMILIGLFFLLINFCIFVAMWYVRNGVAVEYGYPKRNKRILKKKIASYTIMERLSLIRITREAERKGPMLYINITCHWLNLLSFVISCVGFVCCMITLVHGWAITLLILPVISIMFLTVTVEFIPHLIWLPSERRRYFNK